MNTDEMGVENFTSARLLDYTNELELALTTLRLHYIDQIASVARVLAHQFALGSKLLICGNGGSAADAQHMAAELVSSFEMGLGRDALPALALTTDTSILTAYANDFGFENVFARQVAALGRPGDCLLGISTSGNSKNVISAMKMARTKQLTTIGLTGASGGELRQHVDHLIAVPSENTQVIQNLHLTIEHTLCAAIEREACTTMQKGEL